MQVVSSQIVIMVNKVCLTSTVQYKSSPKNTFYPTLPYSTSKRIAKNKLVVVLIRRLYSRVIVASLFYYYYCTYCTVECGTFSISGLV